MGIIGAWALKNLSAIAMGLVITGALGYVEVLRLEVSHDKRVIAADKITIRAAKLDIADLEKSIDQQNAATQALGVEQARTQAAAAKALAQAQAARVTVSKQVAQIAAAKSGTDQCKSADQLILGSLPS